MGRKPSREGERTIRKNITLPSSYEERLDRLRMFTGSASDSELIRRAINKLEEMLPPQKIAAAE